MNQTINEFLKGIASKGGKRTLKKYGKNHFRNLSKLAAIARKRNADKRRKLSTV